MDIKKEGRYITFTKEDGKVAKFDLATGDKFSWTGRRVKSLSSFFAGTNTTLGPRWHYYRRERKGNPQVQFPDEHNQKMYMWLRDKYSNFKALDSFLSLWARNFDAEKWIALGIKPSTWQPIVDIKLIPKPMLKMRYTYDTYCHIRAVGQKNSLYLWEKCPVKDDGSFAWLMRKANDYRHIEDFSKHSLNIVFERAMASDNHFDWDFRDCVTMAHQLGVRIQMSDLTNPDALRATHKVLQRDYKLKKNEIAAARFKQFITDKWNYQDDTYIVSFPDSTDAIIKEGQDMGHCVASYAGNVNDDMSILFLRLVTDPDKSFVTLERKGTELYQAKAMHNRRPTEETLKFLDKYCKAKKLNRRGW